MNSESELLMRLLKLYPVKVLKESFCPETTTQAEQIPEIVENSTLQIINKFALDNYNSTKQHISLYKLDRGFARQTFQASGLSLRVEEELVQFGGYTFKFLHKEDFQVVVLEPYEEITLSFYQPIILSIRNKDLIIQATTLEKNMDNYFPHRRVVDFKKVIGEDSIVNSIVEYFRKSYRVEITDLNRGLKSLWDRNIIDSKYAKWKKSRSTTTEVMDEEFTLKEQYPDVYNALINAPLSRMIFKHKINDESLCNHFTVDPSNGTLSITIYPDNQNQIENVLREILSNN